MVEMLKTGKIISYRVHEPTTSDDYVGTAPIIRANARANQADSHYIVKHDGAEIVVYLDEVIFS